MLQILKKKKNFNNIREMSTIFYQLVLLQLESPYINNKSIWKLFYLACKKGETEAVKYLLILFPYLKHIVTIQKENSSLWVACYNGQLETAKYLTEAGFSLTKKNVSGYSLFYGACMGGHLSVAKWLANNCEADINARSTKGGSPIGEACYCGHLSIVKWLIEDKKVITKIPDHPHLLTIASIVGHLNIVKYLLTVDQMSYHDATITTGQTPLISTAIYGRLSVLKFYLQQNFGTVNDTTSNGKSLLWLSCSKGNLEMVQWLVEKGKADIEQTDSKGRSPLFIACEEDNLEVVEYLLICGKADPNATLERKVNPLLLACQQGNLQMVKVLVDAGAYLKDNYHSDPIHVACMNGRQEVVKYLISMKIQIHVRDSYNKSPLYYAIKNGHLDIIRYLIDNCNATERQATDRSLIHFSVLVSLRNRNASVIKLITSRIFVSERILNHYRIPYYIKNYVRLGRTQFLIRRKVFDFLGPLVSNDVADIVLAYMD